jgi:hypothetical protein
VRPCAPRSRSPASAIRRGFEAHPRVDSPRSSSRRASAGPRLSTGVLVATAASVPPTVGAATGDASGRRSRAGRRPRLCASPAKRWRAGFRRVGPESAAVDVCRSASMRPTVAEAPDSQERRLDARRRSSRWFGGRRQRPSAWAIVSRITPSIQPARPAVQILAKDTGIGNGNRILPTFNHVSSRAIASPRAAVGGERIAE